MLGLDRIDVLQEDCPLGLSYLEFMLECCYLFVVSAELLGPLVFESGYGLLQFLDLAMFGC